MGLHVDRILMEAREDEDLMQKIPKLAHFMRNYFKGAILDLSAGEDLAEIGRRVKVLSEIENDINKLEAIKATPKKQPRARLHNQEFR